MKKHLLSLFCLIHVVCLFKQAHKPRLRIRFPLEWVIRIKFGIIWRTDLKPLLMVVRGILDSKLVVFQLQYLANTAYGAELYIYPDGDTADWGTLRYYWDGRLGSMA